MHTFYADTTADAQEVNENFTEVTDRLALLEGLGAYLITFDNGTSTRSTVGTTETQLAGAQGDTTYTAPDDLDITLRIVATIMADRTAGTTYVWISINGVKVGKETYITSTSDSSWANETLHWTVDVDAGETVDIGLRWKGTSGTHTVTNNNTDSVFNNVITYTAHPRQA